MKKETKEKVKLDRRQFGKILGGVGIAAAGMALGGAAVRAEAKSPVTGKAVKHASNSQLPVDMTRYKRFNGKNMAFNVNSRELGGNWLEVMRKNVMANIQKGHSAKGVDAGGVPQARSEAAFFLATDRMNEITGTHGENMENKGHLSWTPEHPCPIPPTRTRTGRCSRRCFRYSPPRWPT